ncbi:MAG: MmgE/PrpD family protein [Syntrophales bacterium]
MNTTEETGVTRALAEFVAKVSYNDLPQEVIQDVKRFFLDSIGCALAGWTVDKGRLAAALAEKLGGDAQSLTIGGKRISTPNAAFANGELMNALDFDPTCKEGHIVPYAIPAILALSESVKASGQDLILSLAVAQEVATRLGESLSPLSVVVEAKDGTRNFQFSSVYGLGSKSIGGVAGSAKAMGLDVKKTLYAIGLAGRIAPVPSEIKWAETLPSSMDKYLSPGMVSQTEVLCALLADTGYTGDTSVLDGENGFWKFFGSTKWEPRHILEGLGKTWHFPTSTYYKLFPCCAIIQHGLELFASLIDDNKLTPDDIDEVKVCLPALWAGSRYPLWTNKEISTHIETQFSVPYTFSVVAHRLKSGPRWQHEATIRRKDIVAFMNKVNLQPNPKSAEGKEWIEPLLPTAIEVKTKGRTFRDDEAKAVPKVGKLTNNDLIDKFTTNAQGRLSEKNARQFVKEVFELEKVKDVSQLMRLVAGGSTRS